MMRSVKNLIMFAITVIAALSTFKIESKAASSYDSVAALEYAEENWDANDGTLCAEYVSNIIKAGGINGAWSKSCTYLRSQLLAIPGLGEEHEIILESDNSIDMNKYRGVIKPGDVVFYYCGGCTDGRPYIHSVICAGEDNGRMTAYSHNAANNGTKAYKYNSRCYSCGTTLDIGYVFHFSDRLPIGCLDVAKGGKGTISLRGWSLDPDVSTENLTLHVYVGGPAGSKGAHAYIMKTGKQRIDVHNVYGMGENHGFEQTIDVKETGTQEIYVYALNNRSDCHNPLIGKGTVYIEEATKNNFTIEFDDGDSTKLGAGQHIIGFTFKGDGIYTMRVECGDESVIKPIAWKTVNWRTGNASLQINALKHGNSTLKITLLDKNYKELFKKSIKITVAENVTSHFSVNFPTERLELQKNQLAQLPIGFTGGQAGEEEVDMVFYDKSGNEIYRKKITVVVSDNS